MASLIAYAAITNTLLMTIYSMNNMPYASPGRRDDRDLNERAKLNSCRFIAVNAAQFIVGGFTLPLVAKFSVGLAGGPGALGTPRTLESERGVSGSAFVVHRRLEPEGALVVAPAGEGRGATRARFHNKRTAFPVSTVAPALVLEGPPDADVQVGEAKERQAVSACKSGSMARGHEVARSVVQGVSRLASRPRKKGCCAGAMSVNWLPKPATRWMPQFGNPLRGTWSTHWQERSI